MFSDEPVGQRSGQGQTATEDMSPLAREWGKVGKAMTRLALQPPPLVSTDRHSAGLELPKAHHLGNSTWGLAL